MRIIYPLRAGRAPETEGLRPNDSLADGRCELLLFAVAQLRDTQMHGPYACRLAGGRQDERSRDDAEERQIRPVRVLFLRGLYAGWRLLVQRDHRADACRSTNRQCHRHHAPATLSLLYGTDRYQIQSSE